MNAFGGVQFQTLPVFPSTKTPSNKDGGRITLNRTPFTRSIVKKIEDKQLPFAVKDFRKRWNTALRNAGINKRGGTREENYHFHDLRSYFASELIRRNTNPLIVQNLFAHSDMSITTVYAQTDEKLMLEAVKRLDESKKSDVQESAAIH